MSLDRRGAERARPGAVLTICCFGLLVVGLDTTCVAIALPAMRRDLAAELSQLQWVLDVYTLTIGALLLRAGSLADRFGRRRILRTGFAVFSVGSLLCACAPTVGVLVGARVVQALGGCMISPAAMSIVRTTFDDPARRARAIGVFSSTFGVSMAFGPVLGGLLVSAVSWRAVFLVAVPAGVLGSWLAGRHVVESKAEVARRPDLAGQYLFLLSLAGMTAAVIEWGRVGAEPWLATMFAVSVGLFVVLCVVELRQAEPLIEVRAFRSRMLACATAIAVAVFVALGGFLLIVTLYLQEVRELSAQAAGLYLLPTALAMIVSATVSGRALARWGALPSFVGGGLAIAAAGAALASLSAATPALYLFLALAVFGVGFGLAGPPVGFAAVSGLPAAQAGTAAALASTARQVGMTVGVAVFGAWANIRLAQPGAGAPGSGPSGASFTHATSPIWWSVSGLGIVVALLGILSGGRTGGSGTAGEHLEVPRNPARNPARTPARTRDPGLRLALHVRGSLRRAPDDPLGTPLPSALPFTYNTRS